MISITKSKRAVRPYPREKMSAGWFLLLLKGAE
jgi:hypothetical protein